MVAVALEKRSNNVIIYHGKAHVDDEEVARKFGAFKADVKRIGSYGKLLPGTRAT